MLIEREHRTFGGISHSIPSIGHFKNAVAKHLVVSYEPPSPGRQVFLTDVTARPTVLKEWNLMFTTDSKDFPGPTFDPIDRNAARTRPTSPNNPPVNPGHEAITFAQMNRIAAHVPKYESSMRMKRLLCFLHPRSPPIQTFFGHGSCAASWATRSLRFVNTSEKKCCGHCNHRPLKRGG